MTASGIAMRGTSSARSEYEGLWADQFVSSSSLMQGVDPVRQCELLLQEILRISSKDKLSIYRDTALGAFGLVVGSCSNDSLSSLAALSRSLRALVSSDQRRQDIELLADQIRSLADSPCLEDEEAACTARLAMRDALSFIQRIPTMVALPSVSVSEDGEIVLLWSDPRKRAEASFPGTGEFGYAMREGGRFRPGREKGDPTVFPEDLLVYLR